MQAILKIILGSLFRHWLGSLLAVLVARHFLSQEFAAAVPLESAFSNDYVFDALAALVGALLPFFLSVCTRLRSKLKQRLSLLLPARTTEKEVKAIIAEAPLAARISATLTADPAKLFSAAEPAASAKEAA